MGKVDVYSRARPEAVKTAFSASEPGDADVIEMSLAPLDPMQRAAADQYAADLCAKYITGGWIEKDPDTGKEEWNPKPTLMPLVDNKPIMVSEAVMVAMARIEMMQGIRRGLNDDAPTTGYGVEELHAIAVTMPAVWSKLQIEYRRLMDSPDAWAKKGSPALSETS